MHLDVIQPTTLSKGNTMPNFSDEVLAILNKPINPAALAPAPRGLTSIKSIYITERLTEAFGVGRWNVSDEVVNLNPPWVVVKATLELLDYPWFKASSYGGNNNPDLGDAYKGAVSDAISKIGAVYLGIAIDVFKGLGDPAKNGHHGEDKTMPPIPTNSHKPEDENQDHPKPGSMDAQGKDAVSEGKARRFWAIAKSTGKRDEEIKSALGAAGLSDIKNCPYKGETYDRLVEWAGTR
jgi:hypothetical protein